MKALILNEQVVQVEEQEFPVAPPLYWVDCQNEVQAGWKYENNVFIEPSSAPVVENQKFTSLEFLAMFTQAEQLAVVSATLVSAQLKLWYDMMLAASYVDLTDQRTIDGLSALVSAGLLTEQRKNEILG